MKHDLKVVAESVFSCELKREKGLLSSQKQNTIILYNAPESESDSRRAESTCPGLFCLLWSYSLACLTISVGSLCDRA